MRFSHAPWASSRCNFSSNCDFNSHCCSGLAQTVVASRLQEAYWPFACISPRHAASHAIRPQAISQSDSRALPVPGYLGCSGHGALCPGLRQWRRKRQPYGRSTTTASPAANVFFGHRQHSARNCLDSPRQHANFCRRGYRRQRHLGHVERQCDRRRQFCRWHHFCCRRVYRSVRLAQRPGCADHRHQ